MTLVALGLLLGVVGLVWVMVIDITQADTRPKDRVRESRTSRSRRQHVASSRQRTEFRYGKSDKNVFLLWRRSGE
jgi:hypothetical protein